MLKENRNSEAVTTSMPEVWQDTLNEWTNEWIERTNERTNELEAIGAGKPAPRQAIYDAFRFNSIYSHVVYILLNCIFVACPSDLWPLPMLETISRMAWSYFEIFTELNKLRLNFVATLGDNFKRSYSQKRFWHFDLKI